MKKYFIHDGNQQNGPFSIDDLKNRSLKTNTMIWFEGLSDWKEACEIEELKSFLIVTPPTFIKTPPPFSSGSNKVTQNISSDNYSKVEQKKKKSSKTVVLLIFFLILSIIAIVLINKGYNFSSVINTPNTIDLTASCSQVTNLLVASSVDIIVSNKSNRTHYGITVNVIGYDKNENEIVSKNTTFERALAPNSNFSKTISLPAKTKFCECIIISSTPN